MSAFMSEAAYQKATMQHSRIEHDRAVALGNLVEKIKAAIIARTRTSNYRDTASSILAVILEDVFARTEEGL